MPIYDENLLKSSLEPMSMILKLGLEHRRFNVYKVYGWIEFGRQCVFMEKTVKKVIIGNNLKPMTKKKMKKNEEL